MENDDKNRMFNSLDKMEVRLDSIDVTLIKQSGLLEEHMRRSLANEENVDILRQQLKPIEEHVSKVNFLFKVMAWAIGAFGTIYIALDRISKLK